jgi:anti-anti-sigma regulatory factor
MVRAQRADCDVVVDLSELGFADSSLMFDLAMLARQLRLRGCSLRIRGAQPHIVRLIELVGVHSLPGVELEGAAPSAA